MEDRLLAQATLMTQVDFKIPSQFLSRNFLGREGQRWFSDTLLKQMLPAEISDKLMRGERVAPQSFEDASVFFSDIVGFTSLSSGTSPFAVVDLLNALYLMFDDIISTYDAYKVETIGDAYM